MNARSLIEAHDWEPRPADIAWVTKLVQMTNDGGTWVVPMNGAVYTFDKAQKILWLDKGEPDDIFQKNNKVFGKIGWQVRQRGDDTGGGGGDDQMSFAEDLTKCLLSDGTHRLPA